MKLQLLVTVDSMGLKMKNILTLVKNLFLFRFYSKNKFRTIRQLVKRALVNIVANYNPDDLDHWVLDSGSTFHAVKDKDLLGNIKSCEVCGYGFSGQSLEVTDVGDALLPVEHYSSNEAITLTGVYFVEGLKKNVISVSRLTTDFPYSVEFDPNGFVLENLNTKEVMAKGQQFCNFYYWPGIELSLGKVVKAFWNMVYLKTWINCPNNIVANEKVNHLSFLASDTPQADDLWILDSGAPVHVANIEAQLQDLCPYMVKFCWNDLQGRESVVTHVGTAQLGDQNHSIMLHSVQLVPRTEDNLISIAAMTSDNNCCVKFDSNGFVLKSLNTNKVIARGSKFDNVYYLSNKTFTRERRFVVQELKRRSTNKKRKGKI